MPEDDPQEKKPPLSSFWKDIEMSCDQIQLWNEYLVRQINIKTFLVLTVTNLVRLTCLSKQLPKGKTRVKGDYFHMKVAAFDMTVLLVFTKPNSEHLYPRLERVA
jgi:hypothetical protein